MRVIGLDVHRTFATVAVLDNTQLSHPGRVDLTREAVLAFGRKLRPDDEVVIEATVNTAMIARLLHPFVGKVIIANPLASARQGRGLCLDPTSSAGGQTA